MSQRFSIVRFLLGGLLLVAAALKLHGLSVSAIPRVGWFSQPWVQLAAVEWELVLGLWLISGSHQRAAWLAALLTFAAFATISGYLGWSGVAACGCFGVIHASPWWAFGADCLALTALISGRLVFAFQSGVEEQSSRSRFVRWLADSSILETVSELHFCRETERNSCQNGVLQQPLAIYDERVSCS
jgi:hypothetical protein